MSPSFAIVLIPAAIAAIISVSVPWLTFRLALRQDSTRRMYDQRAQLYVDLLTEAYAEREWFNFESQDAETRQRMRVYFHDLRLPPLERARLGARANIFGSRPVVRLFNDLQGQLARASLTGKPSEAELLVVRMNVAEAAQRLEQAVRSEMGGEG
jgi:hypothetical protein